MKVKGRFPVTGRLRLGFFGAAMLELTGPFLDTIAELAPAVEVDLHQRGWEDPSAALSTGAVDCAILPAVPGARAPGPAPAHRAALLAVHHRHRLAARRRLSFSEVLDEPITQRRTPDDRWRDFWIGTERRAGRAPIATVEIANLDEEMQAVASGPAVGLTAARACTSSRSKTSPRRSSLSPTASRRPSWPLSRYAPQRPSWHPIRHSSTRSLRPPTARVSYALPPTIRTPHLTPVDRIA